MQLIASPERKKRSVTLMSERGCRQIQQGFPPFSPNISEASLRGVNVSIYSFIFTEKVFAQIRNIHLLSKQVSSGQCISFADLLLFQYSAPVLILCLKGYPS